MVRLLLCCALLALAACSRPQPPEKERPVDPQAQAHTELRDAIQAPIDKARQVDADVQKAQDAQDAALEAAGG
ncbi:hypothetical protein [Lysobacter solisilvae (ex Woo and Kim 2020)]|uniref:Lipoprotein n=1 Tax=Agrilutibacter terrestris TaxID=2865112 RepID=A0A7H0FUA8_9GAMM|nr:hypothetical protein [Lysobacter terrestris]QNP39624.1 hypothetical protein H8B22_08775 [Lysobacter terrestris]